MKRLIICFALFLCFCGITSFAFATDYDLNFYTSDTLGGSFVDTFNKNQDIWLYINLPKTGLSLTTYWFTDPNSDPYLAYTDPTTLQASWYKLNDLTYYTDTSDDEYTWDQIVSVGDWNVAGTYSYPGKTNITGRYEANFKVVPEPVSATLFVVGGIGLAVLRRKK